MELVVGGRRGVEGRPGVEMRRGAENEGRRGVEFPTDREGCVSFLLLLIVGEW